MCLFAVGGLCVCVRDLFLLFTPGGGTGSGLGSYALHALEDELPRVTRITTAV